MLPVPQRAPLALRLAEAAGVAATPAVRLAAAWLPKRPLPPSRAPVALAEAPITSSSEEIDEALAALRAAAPRWAATSAAERAAVARACAAAAAAALPSAAAAAVAAKGAYESGAGEEAVTWVTVVAVFAELGRSLDALASGRCRALAGRTLPGGRRTVRVLPTDAPTALAFPGFSAEVHLLPGASAPTCGAAVAVGGPGSVALVLGAGNQPGVVAADVAAACLVRGCAALLKLNPAGAHAAPALAAALAPLVAAGALRLVGGGSEVGARCAAHPEVQSIHVTGSGATYAALVWGPGGPPPQPQPGAGPAAPPPPQAGRVTAELGNVTPYVIVPGAAAWTAAELRARADEVAGAVAHNCSANCLAAKLVLLHARWRQKGEFMAALRAALGATRRRCAWYPGQAARLAAFVARYPGAELLGVPAPWEGGAAASAAGPATLPFVLLPPAPLGFGGGGGASDGGGDDMAATTEAWSPVLAVREVDTADAGPGGGGGGGGCDTAGFLEAARGALHASVFGTLCCAVFVHPADAAAHPAALAAFLQGLRYGAVVVNGSPAVAYFFAALPWGAFPGAHTPRHPGSGMGPPVHNALLVDAVEKVVLTCPWALPVTGFMCPRHANLGGVARAAARHALAPSFSTALGFAVAAVQG